MKICLQCRYFYHGRGKKPSLCTNRHSDKFPNKLRQNGHSSVCKHFRPPKHKHDPAVSFDFKRGFRYIESLRGRYAEKEIWVFATGPTLDDLPEDFLREPEPKICIAVKEAAMAFPDCTYNIFPFRDYPLRHIYLPRGQIPGNFGKFIFTIRPQDRENYYRERSQKAIFLRYNQGGTVEKMRASCEAIIAGTSSVYYGIGTITHLAIAAALVMSAKKVSLVGCDHGTVDGKRRAERGIKGGYGWQHSDMRGYAPMKVGTNFLADFFRGHGIEIARYYHGRGYERVGGVVEDEDTIKKAEGVWKGMKKEDAWEMRGDRSISS